MSHGDKSYKDKLEEKGVKIEWKEDNYDRSDDEDKSSFDFLSPIKDFFSSVRQRIKNIINIYS